MLDVARLTSEIVAALAMVSPKSGAPVEEVLKAIEGLLVKG